MLFLKFTTVCSTLCFFYRVQQLTNNIFVFYQVCLAMEQKLFSCKATLVHAKMHAYIEIY